MNFPRRGIQNEIQTQLTKIISTFIDYSHHARCWSKLFVYVISFNLHNHPTRSVLLLSTFIGKEIEMQTDEVICPHIKCSVGLQLRFGVDSRPLALDHWWWGAQDGGCASQQFRARAWGSNDPGVKSHSITSPWKGSRILFLTFMGTWCERGSALE